MGRGRLRLDLLHHPGGQLRRSGGLTDLPEGVFHLKQDRIGRPALRAGLQMLLQRLPLLQGQRAVQGLAHPLQRLFACQHIGVHPPLLLFVCLDGVSGEKFPSWTKNFFSASRARAIRDFTVPRSRSNTAPIS